jgi:predicted adenylyl cyclase CyaB
MSQSYEIEVKSLLGDKENADKLKKQIVEKGGVLNQDKSTSQLNHYFVADDYSPLREAMSAHVPEDRKELFHRALDEGKGTSVRTRQADKEIIFVIKASVDDESSSNGTKRIEFEETVQMTLDELDQILLSAGLTYQAKWSRDREEYNLNDINISIDKNAGYGYLSEFEKVSVGEDGIDDLKTEILDFMKEFDLEELAQDRLGRMFDFYNKNWADYYGTDKVFNIE